MRALDLYSPVTPPQRVVVLVCVFFLLSPLTCGLGWFGSFFVADGWALGYALLAVKGLLLMLSFYQVLRVFRSKVLLDGTVVVVSGALSTRRCDLATAQVAIGSQVVNYDVGTAIQAGGGYSAQVPILHARDQQTGAQVTIELRRAGTILDPYRLNALATAITAGHRPEPDASHAKYAADGIRQLANNPVHRLL